MLAMGFAYSSIDPRTNEDCADPSNANPYAIASAKAARALAPFVIKGSLLAIAVGLMVLLASAFL